MISSQDITANDIGGNIKLALEGSAGERTACSVVVWKVLFWGSGFKDKPQGRSESILSKDQLRAKVKANLQTTISRP